MTGHSVKSRDGIFLKGSGFLFFARNMGTNIGKNVSKNLRRKCWQKRFDQAIQSATVSLKTASKKQF